MIRPHLAALETTLVAEGWNDTIIIRSGVQATVTDSTSRSSARWPSGTPPPSTAQRSIPPVGVDELLSLLATLGYPLPSHHVSIHVGKNGVQIQAHDCATPHPLRMNINSSTVTAVGGNLPKACPWPTAQHDNINSSLSRHRVITCARKC